MSKISVVVPAFNEEELLPRCLKSLQDQDYAGDYEVIVVDNASTDKTNQIARESGVKVISCAVRGVAYARQTGASAATGDVIVQADADTIYPRYWLSRISQYFSTHSSAALAGFYVYADPPSWSKTEYFWRHVANLVGLALLRRPACISGANFAFRREAFIKADGYDPGSLYPDQWGISYRLSKVGKVGYMRNLEVATAARRVQNPFYIILFQVARNATKVFGHFLRYISELMQSFFTRQLPAYRPATLAVTLPVIAILGTIIYGTLVPTAQVFGKVYYKGETPEKVVALTFDDGPNEPYTSQVLDILDRYNIKATFFVVGKNVELYPDTARRMVAEGHVLGNHSYSHGVNAVEELKLAEEAISNIGNIKPHLYRPPNGVKSPWELETLKQENMVAVTWCASTTGEHYGWIFGTSSDEVAEDIISEVAPGIVIQLHDGYGINHDDFKSDKSMTVKALPTIIEELQKQGYRFVTVPELLGIPAYNN